MRPEPLSCRFRCYDQSPPPSDGLRRCRICHQKVRMTFFDAHLSVCADEYQVWPSLSLSQHMRSSVSTLEGHATTPPCPTRPHRIPLLPISPTPPLSCASLLIASHPFPPCPFHAHPSPPRCHPLPLLAAPSHPWPPLPIPSLTVPPLPTTSHPFPSLPAPFPPRPTLSLFSGQISPRAQTVGAAVSRLQIEQRSQSRHE